jgi:hypothetical protein
VLALVGLAVAWAILFPNTETRRVRVEQCRSCFAVRRASETGLWFHGYHLVGGRTSVEVDADGATDLRAVLGREHVHRWGFSAMHFSCLGASLGVACGNPGFNPVAQEIRNDPGMNRRIEDLVRAGSFTTDEVAAILDLPGRVPVEGVEAEDTATLYRRGQELLRAVGADEARGWGSVKGRESSPDRPAPKDR